MSRGLSLLVLMCVLGWSGIFAPAAFAAQLQPAQQQSLLLKVQINGREQADVQEFVARDGQVFATKLQLLDLGLLLPDDAKVDDDGLIGLSGINGWDCRLDVAAQVVSLTIPTKSLKAQQLIARQVVALGSLDHTDVGAVLNYDAQFTRDDGRFSSSVLDDLRVFGPAGVLESSVVQTHSQSFSRTVRLDSTFSTSDPTTLRTYNVGDFINAGLSWTRPVRMLGAQMTTNFALRPDLVTYPRPGMTGEVAVPSSVDIFVNGLHQSSTQVEPGPFELNQLPVTSGGGDISVVVKDASGRETTQTLPFYASSLLLNQGLDSLAVQAGSVRRLYATRSNDYAQPAASLSYRHGATPKLSVETHLETTSKLAMGGVGLDVLLGGFGVLSTSVAASSDAGAGGRQYGVGFARSTPQFSFGFSVLKTANDFADIASVNDDAMPKTTVRANVGFPVAGVGTFGLVYAKKMVNLYTPDEYDVDEVQASERISTSTLSATLSTSLPMNTYGFVTAFHDFDGNSGNGLYVGITLPFGTNVSVSASTSSNGGSTYQNVQAQQSAVQRGDVGWQIARQTGTQTRSDAGVSYKSAWGEVGTEYESSETSNAYRATARGALSTIDGHLFASNTVNDSFAVVDTDGLPGITVSQENRPVGKTDADGLLLVEDLRAYQSNRLSIDPGDVPMDVSLSSALLEVRPADRTGVVARFPVQRTSSATLVLVDEQGRPLQLGSSATLGSSGEQGVVGYDGVTFFLNLAKHDRVSVTRPGHTACLVSFDYQPRPNVIPQIGPLTCRVQGKS